MRAEEQPGAAPVERKLAAILSADVVGYSRLMRLDEAGTLAVLKGHRATMADLIAQHRGRIFSTAGDGVLAEFASVVEAVDCAVRIQRALAERNAALPEDRRMWLRIGVNLGDVIVEDGDLYGDGVNIAARLQALAEPGGILISAPVFEQVRDKLALGFDYLGPQAVKSIAAQVPAYGVVLQGGPVPPPAVEPAPPPGAAASRRDPRRHRVYINAALAGVLIVFLFAINMMTDSRSLWFQWPTLGILFLFCLRTIYIFRH